MKKYISIHIAALIGTFAFAIPVFATTATLSPSSVNVTAGESFTVTVKVAPTQLPNATELVGVTV